MSIKDYLKTSDNVMEIEEGKVDNYLSDLQEAFFTFINEYVDLDNLNEDSFCLLEKILELTENDFDRDEEIEEEINEVRGRRKKVVRGGKKTKKVSCPQGYKSQGGRCVRMSSQEKRTRSRSQKKAAKKRRSGRQSTSMKQRKSMRKRTGD